MSNTKNHPSASLYVGDLLETVTEGTLFEHFSTAGNVASIRVCRDNVTRRSLGYAYVNFHNPQDAEKAISLFNNTDIKGRPCRVSWSQRDPTVRRSGVGNIFIKNLDSTITHKELQEIFSRFGNIISCKVALDESGASKGFGFVHFESAEAAERAITDINGKLIQDKKVYVGKFIPKRERLRSQDDSWTNVYIKELNPTVDEETIKELFGQYGSIQNCAIMRNPDGSSRGFGFVNFDNHADAVNAVNALNRKELNGTPIWCAKHQKKSERVYELSKRYAQYKYENLTKFMNINLYIKNLEDEIDEERLVKEFSSFGTIRSAKIMTDEKGNSKGFGFICYTTPEEAQRAISEMNSRILQGCTKPLYVAIHETKDIRLTKLSNRNVARMPPQGPIYPGQQMYGYPNNGVPYIYPQQPMIRPPRTWVQPYQQQIHNPNFYPRQAGGRGGNPGRGRGKQRQPPVAPETFMDISLSKLSSYPAERQKLILGEKLFPLISRREENLAGKITGMLIGSGWGIEELYSLLLDEAKLNSKIDEALGVLKADAEAKRAGSSNQ